MVGVTAIIMTLVSTLVGVYFARGLSNKDKEHEEWRRAVKDELKGLHEHQVQQDLAAKDLASKTEVAATVDKVFDEIKGLRTDMVTFQTAVLAAIGRDRS